MDKIVFDLTTRELTEAPLSPEDLDFIEERKQTPDELAKKVRIHRGFLLAQSDWTQCNDSPLSDDEKSAWRIYRQALRDISMQSEFPISILWPERP